MLQIGALITAVEKRPILRGNVLAARPAKLHAGILYAALFLANFLALFLGQAGKKGFEAGVAGSAR